MSFRLSIISIFVFTLSSNSYSQGSYLERGQSGFGLGSSFTINKNISGFDGSVSYCLRGIIDIGFAAGWFSLKEKIEGSNVSATAVSPFFNIHFLKQNKRIPFSIAINFLYESDTYSSDAFERTGLELGGKDYSFGGTIYNYTPISNTGKLILSLGISYNVAESEITNSPGNSITSSNNFTRADLGASFFFDLSPSSIIHFTPVVGITEKLVTYNLGVGYIFTTN